METFEQNKVNGEPLIHSTVGSLRPKRRWKMHSTMRLQETEVSQLLAPVSSLKRPYERMKRSGRPHQDFHVWVPKVQIAPVKTSNPSLEEVFGFVRSLSHGFRQAS